MAITKVSPDLLDLDSGITITTADNLAQLTLISTDTDSSIGPIIDLKRNPNEAGADNDYIGQLFFTGHNDAGTPEDITYAKLTSQIIDASDGTEDGNIVAFVMQGGSRKDMMRIGPNETVFNESSNDLDFRVESNNNANMLFVDGGNDRVGIGDASPFAKLHVEDTGWSSGSPYGTVVYIQGGATNDANWGHLLLSQSGTTTDTGGRLAFGANGENPIAGIRAKYKGATYGDLAFSTRPSGGTNTERMVIDSSGKIGIGTDSPDAILEVVDAGAAAPGTAFKVYSNQNSAASDGLAFIHSDNSLAPFTALNVKQEGTAGGIISSCTNSSFTGTSIDAAATRNTANASYRLYQGQRTGTAVVFSVNDAGNVQNTNNSFTGLSDQRLKTNIADAGSQWDDIKALKIRTYQWGMGNTGHTQLGVISQEVEAAGMNGLVEESPADEYHIAYNSSLEGEKIKSVKYSVLYMKAVKALQEAMTKIEALEARVTTLEG